jgi:hypothetical protein
VSITDWPTRLGDQHGQRDRAAARDAQAGREAESVRNAASLERWPSIVAALQSLVTRYNEGSGDTAIVLVDDAAEHRVTLESSRNGRCSLVVALDGADVSVRTRSGPDEVLSGTRWVSLSRTDDDAAAYLLRDWLERL